MPFEYLEHRPHGEIKSIVIWLHGLGASGDDFHPTVPFLDIPQEAGCLFIFPHAPVRPITINAGAPMRGWYDIKSLVDRTNEDVDGIQTSSEKLVSFIKFISEKNSVALENIILGGFSQGGALSAYTFIKHCLPIKAGFFLSCYLPHCTPESSGEKCNTPALIIHGEHDPVIPVIASEMLKERLDKACRFVPYKIYPYQHEVSLEAFRDIGAFLSENLS